MAPKAVGEALAPGDCNSQTIRSPLHFPPKPEKWPRLPSLDFSDFFLPETFKNPHEVRLPASWDLTDNSKFHDSKFLSSSLPPCTARRTAGWKRAPACFDDTLPPHEYPVSSYSPTAAPTHASESADSSNRQKFRAARPVSNRVKPEPETREETACIMLQRKGARSEGHVGGTSATSTAVGAKKAAEAGRSDNPGSPQGTEKGGKTVSTEPSIKLSDDRLLAQVDLESLVGSAGDSQPVVVSLDSFTTRNVALALSPTATNWTTSLISVFNVIADNAVFIPKGLFLWELIYPQTESGWPLYNPQGLYYVRLYLNSSWRIIEIDDLIPCDSDNKPLAPQSQERRELWPLLLTKALWKAYQPEMFWNVVDVALLEALTGRKETEYPLSVDAIRHFISRGFWASVKLKPTSVGQVPEKDNADGESRWAFLAASSGAACRNTECPPDRHPATEQSASDLSPVTWLLCDISPNGSQVCLRSGNLMLSGGPHVSHDNAARTRSRSHGAAQFPVLEDSFREDFHGVFSVLSPDHPENRRESMLQKATVEAERRQKELRKDSYGHTVICKPWGKILEHLLGDELPHPLPETTVRDLFGEDSRPATVRQKQDDTGKLGSAHDSHPPKANRLDMFTGSGSNKAKAPAAVLGEILQKCQMPWPPKNVPDVPTDGVAYDGTAWISWEELTSLCHSPSLYLYVPAALFDTVSSSDFFDYDQTTLPQIFPLRVMICCLNLRPPASGGMQKANIKEGEKSDGSLPRPPLRRRRTTSGAFLQSCFRQIPVFFEFDPKPPIPQEIKDTPGHQAAPEPGATELESQAHLDTSKTRVPRCACIVQNLTSLLPSWTGCVPQLSMWNRLSGGNVSEVPSLMGPDPRNAVAQDIELWKAEQCGGQGPTTPAGQSRRFWRETESPVLFSSFLTQPDMGHALQICSAPQCLSFDARGRTVTNVNLTYGKYVLIVWLDAPSGSSVFRVRWPAESREDTTVDLAPSSSLTATKAKKQGTDVPATDKELVDNPSSCQMMSVEDFLQTHLGMHVEEVFITAPETTIPTGYAVWYKAEVEVNFRALQSLCPPPGAKTAGSSLSSCLFISVNLPHGGLNPFLRFTIGRVRVPGSCRAPTPLEEREPLSLLAESKNPSVRAFVPESDLKQLPISPLLRIDVADLRALGEGKTGAAENRAKNSADTATYLLMIEAALPTPVPAVVFSVSLGAKGLVTGSRARRAEAQKDSQDEQADAFRVTTLNLPFRAAWSDRATTNPQNIVLRERLTTKASQAVTAALRITVENLDSAFLVASLSAVYRPRAQTKARKPSVVPTPGSTAAVGQSAASRQRGNNRPASPAPQPRPAPASPEPKNADSQMTPTHDRSLPEEPATEILAQCEGRRVVSFPHLELDAGTEYVLQVIARKANAGGEKTEKVEPCSEAESFEAAPSLDSLAGVADSRSLESQPRQEANCGIRMTETLSEERLRAATCLDGGTWRVDVTASAEIDLAKDCSRQEFEAELLSFWNEGEAGRADRSKKSRNAFLAKREPSMVPERDPPEALSSLAAFKQAVLWRLEMDEMQLLRVIGEAPEEAEDGQDVADLPEVSVQSFSTCRPLQEATEATEHELRSFFNLEFDLSKAGVIKGSQFLGVLENGSAHMLNSKEADEGSGARQLKGRPAEKKGKGGADRDVKKQSAAQKTPSTKTAKGEDWKREPQAVAPEIELTAPSPVVLRRPLSQTIHRNPVIKQFLNKLSAKYRERTVMVPGASRLLTLGGEMEQKAAADKKVVGLANRQNAPETENASDITGVLRTELQKVSAGMSLLDVSDREQSPSKSSRSEAIGKERDSLRTLQRRRRDIAARVVELLQDDSQKETPKEELEALIAECDGAGVGMYDPSLAQKLRNQYAAVCAIQRAQELAEKDGQGLKKDLDAARKAPKRKPEKESSEGGSEKRDVPLTEEEIQELTTLVQTIHDLYAQEGPVRPVNAQKAFAVLEVAKEVLSFVRARHSPVKISSPRLAEQ